jgi:hypothetical protein
MIDSLFKDRYFDSSMSYRLAFREFGTCLGIRCQERGQEWRHRAEKILSVWQKKDLMNSTPERLQAINMVMFATALLPGGIHHLNDC